MDMYLNKPIYVTKEISSNKFATFRGYHRDNEFWIGKHNLCRVQLSTGEERLIRPYEFRFSDHRLQDHWEKTIANLYGHTLFPKIY